MELRVKSNIISDSEVFLGQQKAAAKDIQTPIFTPVQRNVPGILSLGKHENQDSLAYCKNQPAAISCDGCALFAPFIIYDVIVDDF